MIRLPSSPRRSLHVLAASGLVTSGLVATLGLGAVPASAVVPSCASVGYTVEGLGGPNFYIDAGTTPDFRSSYTGYRVTNGTGQPAPDVWLGLSEAGGQALQLAGGQVADQRLGDLAEGASGSRFWYLTAAGSTELAQVETVTVYRHNPALPTHEVLCRAVGGFESVQGTIDASANKVTSIALSDASPTLGSTFTVTVTGDTGTIGDGIANDAESFWMSPSVAQDWPASSFRLIDTSLTLSPDGRAAPTTDRGILRKAPLGQVGRPYTATYTFRAIGFTEGDTEVKPVQQIASGTQVKYTGTYPTTLPRIAAPVSDLAVHLSATPGRLDAEGGAVTYTGEVTGTPGAQLDSFVLDLPAGATFTSGSAQYGATAVADPVPSGGRLVFPGPFPVTSPASTLVFSVTLDGTPGPRTVSLLGTVGPSYVGSDSTVLNGSNAASATVAVDTPPTADDVAVTVPTATDTPIDVTGHVRDAEGDPVTVVGVGPATNGSTELVDGELVYRSQDGYAGPDAFTYTVTDGRGGTATATVHVTVTETDPSAEPVSQGIRFSDPGAQRVGDVLRLDASASSGLRLTWDSSTPATCGVDGDGVLTAVAAGECTVEASQPGDATYAPATPVDRTFLVARRSQEVTLEAREVLKVLEVGGTVVLGGAASSGLEVASTSLTPGTCSVDDAGVVTGVAAGRCSVRLEQDGNQAYAAAEPVVVDLEVTDPDDQPHPQAPARQHLDLDTPDTLLAGPATHGLDVSSSSGLAVDLTVLEGPCTVDGTDLSLPTTGTCVVEATQAGNDDWAPAEPLRRSIRVVAPADDRFRVAPAAVAPRGADLDVLDNDPSGLTLRAAVGARHGEATVGPRQLHYVPGTRFGGTDTFTYEVADSAGRTATATVTVRVPNAAPELEGARTQQVAGSRRTVRLRPTDHNRDPLVIRAVTTEPGVRVEVEGRTVVLEPRRTVSGRVEVEVVVTDPDGATARATVVDRVSPAPVDGANRTLRTAGTRVAWQAAPTEGASYEVRVDGERLCTTRRLHCDALRRLGPQVPVAVRVLGRDGTASEWRAARPEGHRAVLVGTVYFDPEQSFVRPDQRGPLRRTIARIDAMGFGSAHLRGYTDSDGSWESGITLSHARTRTIARWLAGAGIGSREAWYGERDPAAGNDTAAGKARNRRVELWVSYVG